MDPPARGAPTTPAVDLQPVGKVSVQIKIRKKGRYALRLGVVTTGAVVGSKSNSISLRVR
ncbi:MAG: hypothetical protein V7607_5350 [Solirubrobacteraceae bacterium]